MTEGLIGWIKENSTCLLRIDRKAGGSGSLRMMVTCLYKRLGYISLLDTLEVTEDGLTGLDLGCSSLWSLIFAFYFRFFDHCDVSF